MTQDGTARENNKRSHVWRKTPMRKSTVNIKVERMRLEMKVNKKRTDDLKANVEMRIVYQLEVNFAAAAAAQKKKKKCTRVNRNEGNSNEMNWKRDCYRTAAAAVALYWLTTTQPNTIVKTHSIHSTGPDNVCAYVCLCIERRMEPACSIIA